MSDNADLLKSCREIEKERDALEKERDSLRELVNVLGDALSDAVDHLDYIGWGDSWEREAAESTEHEVRIAVERFKSIAKAKGGAQ